MSARVLLVEDDAWLGELYAQLLGKAGFVVEWCRDGYDAMAAIDQRPPAAIVLDLLLPWANGLQLLHELASHTDLARIPVIICSNALPAQSDYALLRPYGVRGMLDKTTMQPHDLVRTVKGVLGAGLSH